MALDIMGSDAIFFKTGIDIKGLQVGTKKMEGIIGGFANAVSATDVFAGIGVSALAAFSLAGKIAHDFSRTFQMRMYEISTISEMTRRDFKGVSDAVLEMTQVIPESAEGLTKALYQIISAGYDEARAMDILRTSGELAIATVTETEVAVDALTSVMNAYGRSTATADEIASLLFTTIREAKTVMEELGPAVSRVTGLWAQMGGTFDQLMATFAAGAKVIKTDVLATGIQAMASAIIRPTDSAKKAAKELGIEFNSAAFQAKGFRDFMLGILDATKGNIQGLADLFPNIRAMRGLLSIIVDEGDVYVDQLNNMTNSVNEHKKAFAIMVTAEENQLTLLHNNIVKKLKPMGDTIVGWVTGIAKSINESMSGTGSAARDMAKSWDDLIRVLLVQRNALKENIDTVETLGKKAVLTADEIYELKAAEEALMAVTNATAGSVTLATVAVAEQAEAVEDLKGKTEGAKTSLEGLAEAEAGVQGAISTEGLDKQAKSLEVIKEGAKKTGDAIKGMGKVDVGDVNAYVESIKAMAAEVKRTIDAGEIKITAPEVVIPEIKIPEVKIEKIEPIKIEPVEVEPPEVVMPEIEIPEIQPIKLEPIKVEDVEVEAPEVKVPDIDIKAPKIKITDVKLEIPEVEVRDISSKIKVDVETGGAEASINRSIKVVETLGSKAVKSASDMMELAEAGRVLNEQLNPERARTYAGAIEGLETAAINAASGLTGIGEAGETAFTSIEDGAKKAHEALSDMSGLQEYIDGLDRVAEKGRGIAAPMKEATEISKTMTQVALGAADDVRSVMDLVKDVSENIAEGSKKARDEMRILGLVQVELRKSDMESVLKKQADTFEELKNKTVLTAEESDRLRIALEILAQNTPTEEMVAYSNKLKGVKDETEGIKEKTKDATGEMEGIKKAATKVRDALIKAYKDTAGEIKEMDRAMRESKEEARLMNMAQLEMAKGPMRGVLIEQMALIDGLRQSTTLTTEEVDKLSVAQIILTRNMKTEEGQAYIKTIEDIKSGIAGTVKPAEELSVAVRNITDDVIIKQIKTHINIIKELGGQAELSSRDMKKLKDSEELLSSVLPSETYVKYIGVLKELGGQATLTADQVMQLAEAEDALAKYIPVTGGAMIEAAAQTDILTLARAELKAMDLDILNLEKEAAEMRLEAARIEVKAFGLKKDDHAKEQQRIEEEIRSRRALLEVTSLTRETLEARDFTGRGKLTKEPLTDWAEALKTTVDGVIGKVNALRAEGLRSDEIYTAMMDDVIKMDEKSIKLKNELDVVTRTRTVNEKMLNLEVAKQTILLDKLEKVGLDIDRPTKWRVTRPPPVPGGVPEVDQKMLDQQDKTLADIMDKIATFNEKRLDVERDYQEAKASVIRQYEGEEETSRIKRLDEWKQEQVEMLRVEEATLEGQKALELERQAFMKEGHATSLDDWTDHLRDVISKHKLSAQGQKVFIDEITETEEKAMEDRAATNRKALGEILEDTRGFNRDRLIAYKEELEEQIILHKNNAGMVEALSKELAEVLGKIWDLQRMKIMAIASALDSLSTIVAHFDSGLSSMLSLSSGIASDIASMVKGDVFSKIAGGISIVGRLFDTIMGDTADSTQEVEDHLARMNRLLEDQEKTLSHMMGKERIEGLKELYSSMYAESWKLMERKTEQEEHPNYPIWTAEDEEALGNVRDKMKQLAQEIREELTGTTAGSIAEGIMKGLQEGRDSISDFADDFGAIMEDALLKAFMNDQISKRILGWYEEFATVAEGGLTNTEITYLRGAWDKLIGGVKTEWDELVKIMEPMGIHLIDVVDDFQDRMMDTAESITDAIIQGFKEGMTSADDFASYFNEAIRMSMEDALAATIQEKYVSKWAAMFEQMKEGGLTQLEIDTLRGNRDVIEAGIRREIESNKLLMEQLGIPTEEEEERPLRGAIKGITQEQAGMLEGQFNAVRMNILTSLGEIRVIKVNTNEMVGNLNALLDFSQQIARNTRYNAILPNIYSEIRRGAVYSRNYSRAIGGVL